MTFEDIKYLEKIRDEYLEELEKMFGERDANFTLNKIYFAEGDPCICYPGGYESKIVDIKLGNDAVGKSDILYWQMAHECFHLLDPHGTPQTNVLEEGIATWFQTKKINITPALGSYREASGLVTPFMNGQLQKKICLLRKEGIRIGEITSQQLQSQPHGIPFDTAIQLAKKFQRE